MYIRISVIRWESNEDTRSDINKASFDTIRRMFKPNYLSCIKKSESDFNIYIIQFNSHSNS